MMLFDGCLKLVLCIAINICALACWKFCVVNAELTYLDFSPSSIFYMLFKYICE